MVWVPPEPQLEEGSEGRSVRARAQLQGLARRIRALRERRGLTQEEFAARCGISVSYASLLERGERSPSHETLVQVADALDLPLTELFKEAAADPDDDPYYARLMDFARRRRLGHDQVDRWLAVGTAMFEERNERPAVAPRTDAGRCTEPGCERPVLAKGLCTAHYHRARRARQGE